ncbi:DHA2 family efflux MFS transporter permease subunit [Solimicrobium silvestre]|uniref:Drug resistance MFS transporter, drug:H+ antiporter-2 (14 Spanner) (DHA2) family n=1 Tax=Solimicrobium silvestre TaxID=2099400 RepID=A0A2S9H2J3_9BURK|nr:DHA2 family efflux MFS transporter permease subunit [Solimicrobium silvestre]PRC94086.1 Drug resistance MFS transporter, drug:H+ antiporter-2 (14 Spanner) (DHA2) family [Solimicrobium silvestre]
MTPSSDKQPLVPLHGANRSLAALTLGLASFMAVVDITIANVSVPTISGNLGISPEEGEWLITSFAVANAICIPLTGWLSRRFGQVKLFVAAVTAFTIASILCGLASSFESLLFFRILQGAVAGPIVPLSQALLVAVFPRERQTLAVAMWAMTNMAGPVVGPMLGGWITDQYSWPWIFLVNAPIGFFVVASTLKLLRGRDTPTVRLPVDVIGLALIAIAVGSLQIGLDRGRTLDWFASPMICVMAILAVLGFIVLIIWELGATHPIIDLRLFAHRNFAVGTIAIAIGFGLYFAALVLIPLWLQTNLGYSSTWAGLVTAPMGIFGIALAPFLGRWVSKNDARRFASIAFIAWAAVAFWRSTMTTQVDANTIAITCLAQGIGIGFFLTPIVSLSLIGIPPEKVAAASGLQTAIRMMSGSLMASLAQTFWDQRSRFHQTHLVSQLTPLNDYVASTISTLKQTGFSETQAWGLIARELDIQAHMLSLNDFFLLSTLLFSATLGVVWLARGPRKQTN